jgi:hypothetical protein
MVGFLWAFLVALVYGAVGFLLHQIRNARYEVREKGLFTTVLWNLVLIPGVALTPLIVLSALHEDKFIRFQGHWNSLLILVFNAGSIYTLFTLTRNAVQSKTNKAKTWHGVWHSAFYMLYYLFLVAGPIASYAGYVYPSLSPAFGGGKTQRVTLIIRSDQLDAARAAGLELSDRRTVEPIEVIFEAPEFFLISPPQHLKNTEIKAIRLRKEIIDVALY